jgi:ribosomal RNA-processing protein 17
MGPQSKRRKTSKVEEITFDDSARQEWLTGFRKRKQQRIKHAQQVAEEKAREMKREERKRVRLVSNNISQE